MNSPDDLPSVPDADNEVPDDLPSVPDADNEVPDDLPSVPDADNEVNQIDRTLPPPDNSNYENPRAETNHEATQEQTTHEEPHEELLNHETPSPETNLEIPSAERNPDISSAETNPETLSVELDHEAKDLNQEELPLLNKNKPKSILHKKSNSVKVVRIILPEKSPKRSRKFHPHLNIGNGSDSGDEVGDIDDDIDDALDEGYMGMECTLERGFSLNESTIARDLRMERYDEVAVKYSHSSDFTRYQQSLKHFIPVRKLPKEKDEMPIDHTGLYSFVSYSWITGLMWKAYKTGLKEDDVPICSKYDMCDYNTDRLEKIWNDEVKRKGKDGASFHRVVLRFIRTRLICGIIFFIITLVMGFIGPTFFMRYLITWLSSEEPVSTGLIWTFGLIFSEFVRILMFGVVWSINYRTGIRLRSACLGLIYKKLMRMSNLGNKSIGQVINLFANDAQRIYDYVVLGPLILGGPLVAIGGVLYILWLLGPWALFGMLTFLLFYPFQYGISRLTSYLRRRTITVTDERVGKMNELLSCVKLIKMYAWEKSFTKSITEIRARERTLLEKSAYVQSISLAMAPTVPVLAAIVTFLSHVGAGYNLTAAQGMTVVSVLLGLVRSSFNMIRFSIRAIVEVLIQSEDSRASFLWRKSLHI